MMKSVICKSHDSPCGELILGAMDGKLCLCGWSAGRRFGSDRRRVERLLGARFEEGGAEVLDWAARELDEYFAGRRREFTVPLLFAGSEFQKNVWRALLDIPYGQTVSYGEQAVRVGAPRAVRAVANANGANAISIFAPCHRVIGADGRLTGYGGGLAVKKALLELEAGAL